MRIAADSATCPLRCTDMLGSIPETTTQGTQGEPAGPPAFTIQDSKKRRRAAEKFGALITLVKNYNVKTNFSIICGTITIVGRTKYLRSEYLVQINFGHVRVRKNVRVMVTVRG